MPKYDEADDEWYHTDRNSTYFNKDLTRAVIETHGERAHLHALEKFLWHQERGDDMGMKMWQEVLFKLDKGEGQ